MTGLACIGCRRLHAAAWAGMKDRAYSIDRAQDRIDTGQNTSAFGKFCYIRHMLVSSFPNNIFERIFLIPGLLIREFDVF